MPATGHVTDPLVGELAGLFERAEARLNGIIGAGLRRGLDADRINTPAARRGDSTHAYRVRQQAQAQAILAELRGQVGRYGPIVTGRAYRAGALAVDRAAGVGGAFGGVHLRAAEALAENMTGAMTAAVDRVDVNIRTVFERADALEAGLPVSGIGGFPFIGRRVDDPYRAAALETVGQGVIAQDTRRQVSAALARRLVNEGVTDALTGYVTKTGGRIGLTAYTSMVARTTTREAVTRGTVNRLQEGGRDLVTISSHPHKSDECDAYDGETFSLSGDTPNYDVLDELPPFHPNCLHVLTPAGIDLDNWEAEVADLLEAPDAPAASSASPAKAPKTSAPAAKIQDLIAAERQASLERGIDSATARTAEQRASLRERIAAEDAGNLDPDLGKVSAYGRDLIRLEDELRAQAAAQGIDYVIGSSIDEVGARRVGEKIRQLADRRATAAAKRISARTETLGEALEEAHGAEQALLEKLAGGKRASMRAFEDARKHPDAIAARAKTDAMAEELFNLLEEERLVNATAYREVLAEVRPGFGTGTIKHEAGHMSDVSGGDLWARALPGSQGDAERRAVAELVADASRYLPREWVEASAQAGDVHVGLWKGRAWHRWEGGGSTIRVRPLDTSTMLHELGHRFERLFPSVRNLEAAFYRRRTTLRGGRQEVARHLSDITGDPGYEAHELAREDKFTKAYIGKDYGGDAFEVLTMGLQGLFHGDHGITRGDKDLVAFILGLLASV